MLHTLSFPPVTLDDLLHRRLIVLTGKGGVGKSLVAAVLGVAASRRGLQTLLVEVDAPSELSRYFGKAPVGEQETEIAPCLFAVNLDPGAVMDEYVKQTVKLGILSRRILESPVYHRFFAAAPGLDDLMVLGKVMTLEEQRDGLSRHHRYDLIVFDAPATGHGVSMLKTPQAALRVAPLGPIGSNARRILRLLRDPRRTAVALVAIPEEMAAVEVLELARTLRSELEIEPAALFLNACHQRRFTADEERRVLDHLASGAEGDLAPGVPLDGALRAARRHIRRRRLTDFYTRRLKRDSGLDLLELPFLYETPQSAAALGRLADRLEATA